MSGRNPSTSETVFRSLIRVQGLVRNLMEPYFARHEISGAQWGVLRALRRAEDEGVFSLRLHDLGQRLLVKPPSVTVLVDRLVRDGLVAREVCSTDLRARQISLTPEGRKLLSKVLVRHPQQIHTVMSGLTEAEQRRLQRLLDRLSVHLEKIKPDREGKASASSPRNGQGSKSRGKN